LPGRDCIQDKGAGLVPQAKLSGAGLQKRPSYYLNDMIAAIVKLTVASPAGMIMMVN